MTWNDFIAVLKGSLLGTYPVGGTAMPVSETFPVVMAHHVKGGFMILPDNIALADIPYQTLQMDMQVVVSLHNDGISEQPRTLWRLITMPPPGVKVSEMPGYSLLDYWERLQVYGEDPDVEPGPKGDKGWSPVFGTEADGINRVVLKILGYSGGEGTAPSLPSPDTRYVGVSGYTYKEFAVNIKGNAGAPGNNAESRPMAYFIIGARLTVRPETVWPFAQGTFAYVTDSNFFIQNNYSQPRYFRIEGEVPVSNDSGSDSWAVILMSRTDAGWPADQTLMKAQTRLDLNYSRMDLVRASPFDAAHKVRVSATILINANQSRFLRIMMTQTNGGSSYYENGMIEAFGL